jgi:hypothetical protein
MQIDNLLNCKNRIEQIIPNFYIVYSVSYDEVNNSRNTKQCNIL